MLLESVPMILSWGVEHLALQGDSSHSRGARAAETAKIAHVVCVVGAR